MSDQRGFTLIEILVSLAIFAMIVIGALGVLGATDQGGFLEGFPTGFLTARIAKDYTSASVFLQAFQEFVASKGTAAATPGSYCLGSGCSPVVAFPSGWTGYPTPPGTTYQLDWSRLEVLVERWYWDTTTNRFSSTVTTNETMTRVRSTLTWRMKSVDRSVTVERFIP